MTAYTIIKRIITWMVILFLWFSFLLYMFVGMTLQESYKLYPVTESEVIDK